MDPAGPATIMHDKVLIVDGNKMIVGGANMGKSAYMYNFDMEVLVTDGDGNVNGSIAQAERNFQKMLKNDLIKRKIFKKCDISAKISSCGNT